MDEAWHDGDEMGIGDCVVLPTREAACTSPSTGLQTHHTEYTKNRYLQRYSLCHTTHSGWLLPRIDGPGRLDGSCTAPGRVHVPVQHVERYSPDGNNRPMKCRYYHQPGKCGEGASICRRRRCPHCSVCLGRRDRGERRRGWGMQLVHAVWRVHALLCWVVVVANYSRDSYVSSHSRASSALGSVFPP